MASTVLPNGIIIPEKYSRDWYNDLYHNWQELDNLLGGGTPKDGTLTIQKNGDTVGTFSANQATNETINITVPDVNDATLTIQKNGTTVDTFTANSSTDKTVNISVPTKTSDLTNDSNFVNSLNNYTSFSWDTPVSGKLNIKVDRTWLGGILTTANTTIPSKTSDLTNDSGFITSDNTKIPLAGSNAISGSLIPATTNAYDLGGSSYQWKSFNGINPGALSLPSNNAVNILSELQSDGYTAPSNGYARAIKNVRTNCASTLGIRNEATGIEDRRITERTFILMVTVPVQAGEKVVISDDWNSVANATVTYGAYFYPCQGNI